MYISPKGQTRQRTQNISETTFCYMKSLLHSQIEETFQIVPASSGSDSLAGVWRTYIATYQILYPDEFA